MVLHERIRRWSRRVDSGAMLYHSLLHALR